MSESIKMDNWAPSVFFVLKNDADVFICASNDIKEDGQITEKKLRAYAYGGVVAQIPVNPRQKISLFERNYDCYFDSQFTSKLRRVKLNDEQRARLYIEPDLFSQVKQGLKNRSEGRKGTGEKTHRHAERDREQRIAKRNKSGKQGKNYVVIDIESCISLGNNKAKPDLIAVDASEYPIIRIAFIEYKCTVSGLNGQSNSLSKHYGDMKKFALNKNCQTRTKFENSVLMSIFDRFNQMYELGLIEDCLPAKINKIEFEECKNTIEPQIIFMFSYEDGIEKIVYNRYHSFIEELKGEKLDENVRFILSQHCEDIVINEAALLDQAELEEELKHLRLSAKE